MENLFDEIQKITYGDNDEDEYATQVYTCIDTILRNAAKIKGITSIYFSQISETGNVFQIFYRKENAPSDSRKIASGCYNRVFCIDNNLVTIEKIADHYANLGFLTNIKYIAFKQSIITRCLISWGKNEDPSKHQKQRLDVGLTPSII